MQINKNILMIIDTAHSRVEAKWLLESKEDVDASNQCREHVKELNEELEELRKEKAATSTGLVLPPATPGSPAQHSPTTPPHSKDKDEVVVVMWDNSWGNPFYWGAGDVRPPPSRVWRASFATI
jgi:hypothetical protein